MPAWNCAGFGVRTHKVKGLCGQAGLSKPLLVDLQGFDLGIECRLRNSELCRRSARTRYSAVAVGKGRLDHLSLLDGQFLSERQGCSLYGSRCTSPEPAFVNKKRVRITNDHGTF